MRRSGGLGAVAAWHFFGARTIAVDVDDNKLNIASKAGAGYTINTSRESMHDKLLDLTDGMGPDVVFEAIGLPQTFHAAVDEVAFAGRVVQIGYAKGPVAYETRLFVQKELEIMGSRNALPEDFRQAIRMLQNHLFPVEDAVSIIAPIEEAPGLLRAWTENPARFSKIMVTMD
jgi:threonine dehydrogenase-like Zn-dependent dehydrogenase